MGAGGGAGGGYGAIIEKVLNAIGSGLSAAVAPGEAFVAGTPPPTKQTPPAQPMQPAPVSSGISGLGNLSTAEATAPGGMTTEQGGLATAAPTSSAPGAAGPASSMGTGTGQPGIMDNIQQILASRKSRGGGGVLQGLMKALGIGG